jgi:hypothetical protein
VISYSKVIYNLRTNQYLRHFTIQKKFIKVLHVRGKQQIETPELSDINFIQITPLWPLLTKLLLYASRNDFILLQLHYFPKHLLIPYNARRTPSNHDTRQNISEAAIRLALKNHNTSIILQANSSQVTFGIDRELARVHAASRCALGVGQFPRGVVDGPDDEGVGGERGAILRVEVGDLETGYVTLGGEEVFVVGL